MTLKKFDLAKNLALRLEGQRKAAAVPGRFGDAAAAVPDRREKRRLDAAAGLVPFACKLPAELAASLRDAAPGHPDGLNGLMAELLRKAMA